MYTIKREGRQCDLTLEHGLQGLEDAFAKIRRDKINLSNPMDEDDHALICMFVAASYARTRAHREWVREQWSGPLELSRELEQRMAEATPEQKENMVRALSYPGRRQKNKGMTLAEVQAIVDQPLQTTLFSHINVMWKLFVKLDLAIYETDGRIGFITSDNPCRMFDPEGYKRPPMYRAPALMYDSFELTLPVSPKRCLFFNRQGIEGYLDAPQIIVDDFNRRTRFGCDEHFIVRRKVTKPIWFDPGVEPDDSWERTHSPADGEGEASGD